MKLRFWTIVGLFFAAGCDNNEAEVLGTDAAEEIPEALAPFGNGYPREGDQCRRLGESAETLAYLDHTTILVGCPTEASAEALGGAIVGNIEGIRLVSIPASSSIEAAPSPSQDAGMPYARDALVPGTEYHATTIMKCGFHGRAPTLLCNAGVRRNWPAAGEALVEIIRPDGGQSSIFFRGVDPYKAESSPASASEGWAFEANRDGDIVTVNFGPETYVIVDELIVGG